MKKTLLLLIKKKKKIFIGAGHWVAMVGVHKEHFIPGDNLVMASRGNVSLSLYVEQYLFFRDVYYPSSDVSQSRGLMPMVSDTTSLAIAQSSD